MLGTTSRAAIAEMASDKFGNNHFDKMVRQPKSTGI